MIDEQQKQIIQGIDKLIEQVEEGEETLSPQTLELLDQITNFIALKKAKDKTKPIEDLIAKLDSLASSIESNQKSSKEYGQELLQAIQDIKIDVPTPQVSVEAPKVQVSVPPISVPETRVEMPKEIDVKKPSWIQGLIELSPITKMLKEIKEAMPKITFPKMAKDAIPVELVYDGKKYRASGGGFASGGIGEGPFKLPNGDSSRGLTDADGNVQTDLTRFAMKITVAGSISYIALAKPGTTQATGKWQARKIDETTGTVVTWADGNTEFDNVATDLTALTYS